MTKEPHVVSRAGLCSVMRTYYLVTGTQGHYDGRDEYEKSCFHSVCFLHLVIPLGLPKEAFTTPRLVN